MNKSPFLLPALMALVIISADIATKYWVISVLKGEPALVVLPLLRLVYVENPGVAFGFLSGSGRWVLVALAAVLMAILLYYLLQPISRGERWACTAMLAGAVGNTIDRLRFGYVVDFIDIHWQQYHYPAFNIADIAITCGGLYFAYFLLFKSSATARTEGKKREE